VLPLFEEQAPSDPRPREAIEGARLFANGGKRTARLRSLAMAAHAAARDVNDDAATAAARSAGVAAATAYTHALATLDQAKHVLGTSAYAALARSIAEDYAAGDEEIHWAIEHSSPAVREIAARFPARVPGRSRLESLYYQVDAGLRQK
jgi:hypothetical protein